MPELYSLETLRESILQTVDLLDKAFPEVAPGDAGVKVGILEGGWTNAEPWTLIVELQPPYANMLHNPSQRAVVSIKPQTLMDFVQHGGGLDSQEYAFSMFLGVLNEFVMAAIEPKMFYKSIARRMPEKMSEIAAVLGPAVRKVKPSSGEIVRGV